MRIQVASDLHLERSDGRGRVECIVPSAPYLALVGDIGDPFAVSYERFLAEQSGRFRDVFVVLGNHEHFHNFGNDPVARAKAVAARFPNVHVLEKDSITVIDDGERWDVVGTTLWTAVDPVEFRHTSDSRCIPGWTYDRAAAEHRSCVRWLDAVVGPNTIVLTHHAPLLDVVGPGYRANPSGATSTLATDLGWLVRRARAWFHGHTHWSHTTTVGRTIVASNAAGLVREVTGYDPARAIDVPPAWVLDVPGSNAL